MTCSAIGLTIGLLIAALVIAPATASSTNPAKTHEVVAKVTAVDLQLKSIRADIGTGRSETVLVVGKAAESLDQLPIGRMFKLTLIESEDGARQDVISIKRTKDTRKT